MGADGINIDRQQAIAISMPRHWSQFGRPREKTTSPPEIKICDSSLNLNLASLDWKDGHVNCGFADDTLWYKVDESHRVGEGISVVKLSFNLNHRVKKIMSRVECHVTFSQAPGKQFHSVHRCWPSSLRGSPNTEAKSKGVDFTPAVEAVGISGSLGGMHLNAERTDQSNWIFTSQRRVSDPPRGGRYDMVVLGWEAGCGNDYVSFSSRELFTTTLLACAGGDLILNTRLTAKRTQNEPQFRVSRTSQKVATTSIQIAMTTGASDKDPDTHGREAMEWADNRNDEAIPKGMANSKPASADSRPEMANSKPSDDKTQQIGHVCNDRALSGDSHHLFAPLVYASAGGSSTRS